MKRKSGNLRKGLLFISPWLIGFVVFTVYPIVASFYYSFTEYHITRPPVWTGLENYKSLFHDALFRKSLLNTLYYVAGHVPLELIIGLFLGVLLVQPLREIAFYRGVVYFPSIVPKYAFAAIAIWFFNPYVGLVNSLLSLFGISGPMWLSDPKWTMPTVILASLWGIGGTALIFMAAIKDVPKELYESAILDGATKWQMFRKITLPMISPAMLYNLVMSTLAALQTFDLPYIVTSGEGGPANSLLTYVMYLYRNGFVYLKMGYASAMAWLLFLIAAFLTLLIFRLSRRWVFYYGSR